MRSKSASRAAIAVGTGLTLLLGVVLLAPTGNAVTISTVQHNGSGLLTATVTLEEFEQFPNAWFVLILECSDGTVYFLWFDLDGSPLDGGLAGDVPLTAESQFAYLLGASVTGGGAYVFYQDSALKSQTGYGYMTGYGYGYDTGNTDPFGAPSTGYGLGYRTGYDNSFVVSMQLNPDGFPGVSCMATLAIVEDETPYTTYDFQSPRSAPFNPGHSCGACGGPGPGPGTDPGDGTPAGDTEDVFTGMTCTTNPAPGDVCRFPNQPGMTFDVFGYASPYALLGTIPAGSTSGNLVNDQGQVTGTYTLGSDGFYTFTSTSDKQGYLVVAYNPLGSGRVGLQNVQNGNVPGLTTTQVNTGIKPMSPATSAPAPTTTTTTAAAEKGTPGFEVGLAGLAVLGAALLVARRKA